MQCESLEQRRLLACSLAETELIIDLQTEEYPALVSENCDISAYWFNFLEGNIAKLTRVDAKTIQLEQNHRTYGVQWRYGHPDEPGSLTGKYHGTATFSDGTKELFAVQIRRTDPAPVEVQLCNRQPVLNQEWNCGIEFTSRDFIFEEGTHSVPGKVFIDGHLVFGTGNRDDFLFGFRHTFKEPGDHAVTIEHARSHSQLDVIVTSEFTVTVPEPEPDPDPDPVFEDEDFNRDGVVDVADLDAVTLCEIAGNSCGGTSRRNVMRRLGAFAGDSNLDGRFDSKDLIKIFQIGKFEKIELSGWGDGDWNGDGVFNSADLVAAFIVGRYEG